MRATIIRADLTWSLSSTSKYSDAVSSVRSHTNVGASVTAVRGIREEKVVLIAGGRDKGGSYGPLALALRERGRAAVLIGEAKELIRDAIGGALPVRIAASMDEAVALGAELARPGDAVLLSPACSSFDMFRDYKDRGDAFVRAVMGLPA